MTVDEERLDAANAEYRFDIRLLADRLSAATEWLAGDQQTKRLRVGYFGASTGAAAALVAAAYRPAIAAVVSRGPFDLVLAADVLYERANVAPLLSLIDRFGSDAWIADPGRPAAAAFLDGARRDWSIVTRERDGMQIHRLARDPQSVYGRRWT